jgi:transposase InsO family protein
VAWMCAVLGLTRSKYYVWREGRDARRVRKESDAALFDVIEQAWKDSKEAYGSPRITIELREAHGLVVNEKRIARLMREGGIEGRAWRPKRPVTTACDPEAAAVPDRLGRVFTADRLGEKYVGDLTYLPIGDGSFLYLTSVIDLCSRRVVGWTITDHMRAEVMVAALDDARRTRGSLDGAIFHSDNGSQYTSLLFRQYCEAWGVLRSRGKVGTSADNALAESFHASLKRELLGSNGKFADKATARAEVFSWLNWYNLKRRHSSLQYRSPIEQEQRVSTLQTT